MPGPMGGECVDPAEECRAVRVLTIREKYLSD